MTEATNPKPVEAGSGQSKRPLVLIGLVAVVLLAVVVVVLKPFGGGGGGTIDTGPPLARQAPPTTVAPVSEASSVVPASSGRNPFATPPALAARTPAPAQ